MTSRRVLLVPIVLACVLAGCGGDPNEVERLRAENTHLTAVKQEMSAQVDALKRAAEARDAELAGAGAVRKQVADLTSQLDEAIASAATRQELFDKTARDLVESQKEVDRLSGALQQTAAQANAAAERSRAQIDALNARVNELQSRLDRAAERAGEDALKRLLPP